MVNLTFAIMHHTSVVVLNSPVVISSASFFVEPWLVGRTNVIIVDGDISVSVDSLLFVEEAKEILFESKLPSAPVKEWLKIV